MVPWLSRPLNGSNYHDWKRDMEMIRELCTLTPGLPLPVKARFA